MSPSNAAHQHKAPPSVASTETPVTVQNRFATNFASHGANGIGQEPDDGSVIASDEVDITSTSTASITEQEPSSEDQKLTLPSQQLQPQPPSSLASQATPSKSPSGTVPGGGTLQLLRRKQDLKQPATSSPTAPNNRMPSPIARVDGNTADQSPVTKESVDPSLLEAFAHPINRQYLLQLEASLNNFVSLARYRHYHRLNTALCSGD